MPTQYISPRFQALDAQGDPLVGGKLYTYARGTTTPKSTYKDAAGTILNTNPIILDGRGEAVIFLTEGLNYTFVLKDSNDALVWSQDDITGAGTQDSGGLPSYPTPPDNDVGSPIYIEGRGWATWNGTEYVSDYSNGFGGGPFALKNKVGNGDFRAWSSATSIAVNAAGGETETACGWYAKVSGSATVTVSREINTTEVSQGGVPSRWALMTGGTAVSPDSGHSNRFYHYIRGYNALSLAMGSLLGGYITLSFWAKASIAGTYNVALMNGGSPSYRSYIATFEIQAANTPELKTITIPIDQIGAASWNSSNGVGVAVVFDLGSGTNYEAAVGTWLATESTRSSGTVRLLAASTGATLAVSNVQLQAGRVRTPFEDRPSEIESLVLNQPWHGKAIGEIFFIRDDMTGCPIPPRADPSCRFIKLTADDAYNSGVLTGETVSGSAPLVTATAVINYPNSPIHGRTVNLLNTERKFLRAGSSGTNQNDALQNITGGIRLKNGASTLPSGAFAQAGAGNLSTPQYDAGNLPSLQVSFDASRVARTDTETRSRNQGATAYMRIF